MTPKKSFPNNNHNRRAAAHCLNFGDKFIREHSWEDAITWLKQAISIQPDYYEAYILLSEAYMELGQVTEAVEELNHAFRLRPYDSDVRFKLGLAYIALHDWNSALDQYRSLRPLDQVVAKKLFDKIVFSFNYEMFDSLFNQIY